MPPRPSDVFIAGNTSTNQLNRFVWDEAVKKGYAEYDTFLRKGSLLQNAVDYLTSFFLYRNKINSKLEKSILFSIQNSFLFKFFTNDIHKDCKILILSYYSLIQLGGYRLRQYRRNGCKIVLYLFDSLGTFNQNYRNILIDYINSPFIDETYSFDKDDCKKYNLKYWSQIYGIGNVQSESPIKYDFYFSGRNKGRLHQLCSIIEFYSKSKLSFLIRIPNLKDSEKKRLLAFSNVTFASEMIPYDEVVKEMLQCRCIVDLVQDNQVGVSWRIIESILFDKRLITNNLSIVYNPYHKQEFMAFTSHLPSPEWITSPPPRYDYKNEYSPIKFIKHLLSKHNIK